MLNIEKSSSLQAVKLIFSYVKSTRIPAHVIAEEFEQTCELIKQYDDGAQFNHHYQETVSMLEQSAHQILSALKQFDGSTWSFIQTIPVSKRVALIKSLFYWDTQLLDLRTLHEILSNKGKKSILLFLGSTHAYQVGRILKNQLGYSQLWAIGQIPALEHKKYSFDLGTTADAEESQSQAAGTILTDPYAPLPPTAFNTFIKL